MLFMILVIMACPLTLVYDSNHQLFVLNFRGVAFTFPIDSKFEVCFLCISFAQF